MDTIECIKSRRSVRDFSKQEIAADLINKILTSAIHSPSSINSQPWHFIIIREAGMKQKLSDLKDPRHRGHILGAPVIIVVCVDKEKSPYRFNEDGAIASYSILLTAHSLGLGAVYVTAFSSTDTELNKIIQQTLGLPEKFIPVSLIPIGYPSPTAKIESKDLPEIDSLIHKERW